MYNPTNWYWIVGGDTAEVWSSAAAAFVPRADATYTAWLGAGNVPTNILNASELYDVLAAQHPAGIGPTLGPVDPPHAFAAALAAGCRIASTATPALDGTYALDDSSIGKITAEQVYIATKGTFTNGQASRGWKDSGGAVHVFPTTAAFTAFAEAMAQYVDALDTALTVGHGSGTWVAPAQPMTIP